MPDPAALENAHLFLWIVFGASTALAIVLGVILSYHWLRFSMNPVVPAIALMLYMTICFMLLSTMFGVVVTT